MISADFRSDANISESHTNPKELENQKLPSIHSLFPGDTSCTTKYTSSNALAELSGRWALESSPRPIEKSMDIDCGYGESAKEVELLPAPRVDSIINHLTALSE